MLSYGSATHDNSLVHVRDDDFAGEKMDLVGSVVTRVGISEKKNGYKPDGWLRDIKGIAKKEFPSSVRQFDGANTNGIDRIATKSLDRIRVDGL